VLCINDIIIICINDENAVNNNNIEGSGTLFCSSKFPWVCESISLKFIDNLGRHPQKCVLALVWGMITVMLENVC
jgi:hypothetical protein